jgi:hypothetical protein
MQHIRKEPATSCSSSPSCFRRHSSSLRGDGPAPSRPARPSAGSRSAYGTSRRRWYRIRHAAPFRSGVVTVSIDDDSQQSERGSAGELLRQGLQAVAIGDWAALRSLVHDDVVWEIPGRRPLAGRLAGPEAVIERFRLMRSVTAGDRPAELVGFLEGGDYAAAVQRNVIAGGVIRGDS